MYRNIYLLVYFVVFSFLQKGCGSQRPLIEDMTLANPLNKQEVLSCISKASSQKPILLASLAKSDTWSYCDNSDGSQRIC